MDHGSFIAHRHSGSYRECAGKELDDERLKFKNVFYLGAVQKANNFWDPGACSRWLVENQSTAGNNKYDGVTNCEGEGSEEVLFLKTNKKKLGQSPCLRKILWEEKKSINFLGAPGFVLSFLLAKRFSGLFLC